MKRLILLSFVMLPFMSTLLDAGGGPPPPPTMPGPSWKQKATDVSAQGKPSPAKPKSAPKPADPQVTGGMVISKSNLAKLPIGTKIMLKQDNQMLAVFAPGEADPLPQNYYNKAGGLLGVTLIEFGSDGFNIDGPTKEFNFRNWIQKKPIQNSVIGFMSGQEQVRPKPGASKPAARLSAEQKLMQNLASLEVNLTTLSEKIS